MPRVPPWKLIFAMFAFAAALFAYSYTQGFQDRVDGTYGPMAFQLAAWAVATSISVIRVGSFRVSEPILLFQIFALLYFIYPSIMWTLGRNPAYVVADPGAASFVFLLHGVFDLAFVGAFCSTSAPSKIRNQQVAPHVLPNAWPLFLIPVVPVVWEVFTRVLAGGSILPNASYAENWFMLTERINAARGAGGALYLIAQFYSKLQYYLVMMQGVGAGILLVRARVTRKGEARALIMIAGVLGASLLLGIGARHYVLTSLVIAFVTADLLARPVSLRLLIPVLGSAMILFEFYGYYRVQREGGLQERVALAYNDLTSPASTEVMVDEFGLMLSKEILCVQLFANNHVGPAYLLQLLLSGVPSQILPEKLNWTHTYDILDNTMLGHQAELGAGVAGTSIGDGYRFGGVGGVISVGIVLGFIYGKMERILNSGFRPQIEGPPLLKVFLIAGNYGLLFGAFRNDLEDAVLTLMYYFLGPLIVLRLVHKKWANFTTCVPLARTRTYIPSGSMAGRGVHAPLLDPIGTDQPRFM